MNTAAQPFAIRIRETDGRGRTAYALKGQLFPHVDVFARPQAGEFEVRAVNERHLADVRAKLASLGLEELLGPAVRASAEAAPRAVVRQLPRTPFAKPYGFVPVPEQISAATPVWHDGSSSDGRLSGEIRCELKTLTPLLVGWERTTVAGDPEHGGLAQRAVGAEELEELLREASAQAHPCAAQAPDKVQERVRNARVKYVEQKRAQVTRVEDAAIGLTLRAKPVLSPLRAPWGDRPVLIPGDSLKGLIRHELGALLGAPMERVAERSYSYRPNLAFPDAAAGRRLEPRLARVRSTRQLLPPRFLEAPEGAAWPFPATLDLLVMATRDSQRYFPGRDGTRTTSAEPYRGGMGGGDPLPKNCLSPDAQNRIIHDEIDVSGIGVDRVGVTIEDSVAKQYLRTVEHLLDTAGGHFSSRHPQVGTDQPAQRAATNAVRDAARRAFQDGDIVWVEWDRHENRVVSIGWHYYYRWAYVDTVRRGGGALRASLRPHADELGAVPVRLTAARRLFGYVEGDPGTEHIGKDDHAQLMGRVSPNAAIEVIEPGDDDAARFEEPIFLPELGMPRPSAVEHYLQQPFHPRARPSDAATVVTYGDAVAGDGGVRYDEPGELAGRKFYLDRPDVDARPWADPSPANRCNERSALALETSRPGRRFRFTVNFRDLDREELAALLLALAVNQLADLAGGEHEGGYCSKLGYGRPLGLGSVQITADSLRLLDADGVLERVDDLRQWWQEANFALPPSTAAWLEVHRRRHPDAADYPRRDGSIYQAHSAIRKSHAKNRRYARRGP
jgi:hypothetical protein